MIAPRPAGCASTYITNPSSFPASLTLGPSQPSARESRHQSGPAAPQGTHCDAPSTQTERHSPSTSSTQPNSNGSPSAKKPRQMKFGHGVTRRGWCGRKARGGRPSTPAPTRRTVWRRLPPVWHRQQLMRLAAAVAVPARARAREPARRHAALQLRGRRARPGLLHSPPAA